MSCCSFPMDLGDVMIFTGVATEPLLGFSNKPNIKFCDGSFLHANTCINAPLPLNSTSPTTRALAFSVLYPTYTYFYAYASCVLNDILSQGDHVYTIYILTSTLCLPTMSSVWE